jgi:uncharacterized lipoprotein YmbA
LALVAGCVGRTPAPNIWQLEPLSASPSSWNEDGVGVFVGAVELPRYLDRPEVLQRVAPRRLAPAAFDRWAEPLGDSMTRVLAEELARDLASERVVAYPSAPRFPVRFHVVLDVDQFDGAEGGDLRLVARWSVLDGVGGPLLATAREEISRSAGEGMAGLIEAHSQAVSELAGRIATAIGALPDEGADTGG